MSKFFVTKDAIKDQQIVISGPDVDHIVRVLRKGTGDELVVCDGEGYDYAVIISHVEKGCIRADILSKEACQNEPKTKVVLYQGLPKQGKMEWIIEKCTELGVSEIVPVAMKRSVVRLTEEQGEKKRARWQKVAAEAAKQCGRGRIPKVSAPVSLKDLKREDLPEFLLLPYEEEQTKGLREALNMGRGSLSAGVFIGPEGGFEPEEVSRLQEMGARCVTLGRRILRTETAGMTSLALLLYEWDEMNR